MDWFLPIAYAYLCALIIAAIAGLINWWKLDRTLKLIVLLLCAYSLTEILSIIFRRLGYKTEIQHHVLSLLELFLIVCTYLSLREMLTKKYTVIVFAVSLFLIVCSAKYIQPIGSVNTYVMVFEGVLFVMLSTHALFLLMVGHEVRILQNPQFWFWTLELVGGTVSVLFWGLYLITSDKYHDVFKKMELGNAIVNLIIYAPLAYAMIMLPKRRARF